MFTVIVDDVFYPTCRIHIMLFGWRCISSKHFVNGFFFQCQFLSNTSETSRYYSRMERTNVCLRMIMPPLQGSVGARLILSNTFMYIAHEAGKPRKTPCLILRSSTNVGIVKVIWDRKSFLEHVMLQCQSLQPRYPVEWMPELVAYEPAEQNLHLHDRPTLLVVPQLEPCMQYIFCDKW